MKRMLSLLLALAMLIGMMPQFSVLIRAEEMNETTFVQNEFSGKTISILGDSISTYEGVSNDASVNSTLSGGAIYYTPGKQGIYQADTWWQQTIDALGMELLVNNSWSGSAVLHTRSGTVGAYIDRCVQLHNAEGETPDIIAVFLGTNDFSYYQSTLGTADIDYDLLITDNGDGTFTYATPTTTCEAYAIMLHKMAVRYPDAEIYCMTMLPRREDDHDNKDVVPQPTAFNAELKKIIQHFGCAVVDLENCGIPTENEVFDRYITDQRVHPGPEGMDKITQALVSAMLGRETQVYSISGAYSGVQTDNMAAVATEGMAYCANLSITEAYFDLRISITMGGEDITQDCYADGAINIPQVTGDIVINAVAQRKELTFRWEYSEGALVSVGEEENELTKLAGTVTDGLLSNTYYRMEHQVILRHNLPWVLEWSASGSWSGMIFSAKQTSSTDGNIYLFKTNGTNGFIGFGQRVGSQYHNYGIELGALGVDTTQKHTYRLENRIADDGSNMVYLFVDGVDYGAMNNYYIGGNSNQGTKVEWLNGKDLTFSYIGANGHAINNCALDYIQVWENACAHTYDAVVTVPTCTEQGYTTHTCATCGDSYTDSYVEAAGHSYDSIVCTVCGNKYPDKITELDSALAVTMTPENYLTISNPLAEQLACAPALVAYGDGKFAVVYLADDVNTVETESSTTIVCRLGLFDLDDPENGAFFDIATAGQTIGDMTIGSKAPYEPNLLKLSDDVLLVLFNIRDTSGNYVYYSATFDTETNTVISYQPLTLDGKIWTPTNIAASYNALVENDVSTSGPADSMVFTSKIVQHEGYYYGYCGGICSGFGGILVRSTDGIHWTSVMAPEALAEMDGVIECGFEFLDDYVYFCMRDISSGVYHCSYDFKTGEQLTPTTKLSGITTSKPAAFIQDCQLYLIVNKATGDDNTVGRRNTALFYQVNPETCRLSLVRQVFCADGVAYHSIVNFNGTNYWSFHTDARRINPYSQGRSNLAFRKIPELYAKENGSADGVLDLDDYSYMLASGCITAASNTWQANAVNLHYQIPLADFAEFDTVTITANSEQKAYIAFFIDWMTQSGPVAYAEGWTEQLIVEPGAVQTLTIPEDAAYLYILYNNAAGANLLPVSVVFSKTEDEQHTHTYTPVVTAPTCTEQGYTTHTCDCGHSFVDSYVEALGHTAGPEATCTTAQTCTVCNAELVAARGHSYTSVVTAPTCTEQGYTTHTCACGHSFVDSYVEALGHTAGPEATCTTAQTCTVCNAELVAARGHSYTSVVTAPTCTEKGYTTHTCACGHSFVDSYVDALGHTAGPEATCTTAQTCTVCNAELVAARGHSYDSAVTAPTCTEQGYTTHTCACGHSFVDSYVEALGHTAGPEATCTTAQTCTVCNAELVAARGHSYTSVVTAPTCTEQGYTTHTCACGHSFVDSYVEALGHTAGPEATCTTAQTCTVCNAELVAARGHSYTSVATAPTCTEKGYTTHTCACGHSFVDSYVDAAGHSFGDWYVSLPSTATTNGQARRDCTCCDHFETRLLPLLGDVNGDGSVNTRDSRLIMQYELGLIDATMLDLSTADVNGDGKFTTADAKLIMQLELGLIPEFPK